CVILNDIMHLRSFTEIPAATSVSLSYMLPNPNASPLSSPTSNQLHPGLNSPISTSMTNPLSALVSSPTTQTPTQQDIAILVTKFSEMTALKPEVALECLQANSFNPDQ